MHSKAATDPKPAGATLTGAWGGPHVLLTLSANGGRIEYDCAQGTLDELLVRSEELQQLWRHADEPGVDDGMAVSELRQSGVHKG